jgi:queuine tRNA-ribosyltransferase
MISFKVLKQQGEARRGQLTTLHGVIETPVFMPVGTLATVKALDFRDLGELGARMILNNAYHLMLRPGSKIVREMGGLHQFSHYNGAILTDSGGFQVFSLAKLRDIDDQSVRFKSHIDGSLIDLSPEKLVEVQEDLQPDIAMVLDECPPGQGTREIVQNAVNRTTAWAKRAVAARKNDKVSWFGIVQGGIFPDIREQHAAVMRELDFPGFAIGGVSVGEAPEEIAKIVAHTAPLLPSDKPRYLMGVGTPQDLVRGVAAGVDMFDCVMPSRNARNGSMFVKGGKLNIKNAAHQKSEEPVDSTCDCHTCKNFTRAYLRHLFVARERTFDRLATIHNIAYYLRLMQRMRGALADGTFDAEATLRDL